MLNDNASIVCLAAPIPTEPTLIGAITLKNNPESFEQDKEVQPDGAVAHIIGIQPHALWILNVSAPGYLP